MNAVPGKPSGPSINGMRDALRAEAAAPLDPVQTSPAAKKTQIIAIYGKGGIGKSFTLALLRHHVAQIGEREGFADATFAIDRDDLGFLRGG